MTAGVYSTADSPGPDIADNAGPGNRNNRQSGPSNDHNAFPYRPCGRFGSPLGGRRPYGGDCPVSDPAEIAPVCFERSVCSPSCTSETCDQVNRTPVLRCDAWQPVQIPLSTAQIATPQEPWHLMNGQPPLQLLCGVGMTQGMNATAFFNTTGCLGGVVGLLRSGDMRVSIRE